MRAKTLHTVPVLLYRVCLHSWAVWIPVPGSSPASPLAPRGSPHTVPFDPPNVFEPPEASKR